ncbi:MAG: site-2 protease family protein [Pirellulales bacterium]
MANWRVRAIWLAIATFFSTFWVGTATWAPWDALSQSVFIESWFPVRCLAVANWWEGLQFSLALMCILAAHEFGHYTLTLAYRVPSTPPLFIPFPLSPLGTLGAVIAMQGGEADRRQIFDIGLAGPLAGLVVTVPILIFGMLHQQTFPYAPYESMKMGQPLLVQWLALWIAPEQAGIYTEIVNSKMDPLLMAGWVGLFVTGLNMMPIGQLDGGHVVFGLLGNQSRWVGMAAFVTALAYCVYAKLFIFWLMLLLVLLMGFRHPPSRDDSRKLGWFRGMLGWASLALPILCIPSNPMIQLG